MNPDHARLAEWDAAYVLGALSTSDRHVFEEHLAECAECTRAVVDVAPTVGLLSRVPAAPDSPDAVEGPDAARRASLVSIADRRTRRRRGWWIAGAAAAAVLAVAVPLTVTSSSDRGATFALADLADVPLEASVRLTDAAWGTRIDLVCRYSGEVLDAPEGGWPYALAVVDADGASTTLSTWRAEPGSTTQLSAGTDLGVGDIGAVEIRTITGDEVLMRYDADQ